MARVFLEPDQDRLVRRIAAVTGGDPTTDFVPIAFLDLARVSAKAVARVIDGPGCKAVLPFYG
jgi:hypothetical protein